MLLLKHATCGEERPAIAGVIPQADPCILQDGKVGRCFTLVLLSFYSLRASIFHETQPSKVSFPCPMSTLRPATSRSSCIMMTKRHGSSQLSFCARCSRCLPPRRPTLPTRSAGTDRPFAAPISGLPPTSWLKLPGKESKPQSSAADHDGGYHGGRRETYELQGLRNGCG